MHCARIMNISKIYSEGIYVSGRLAALASRPLMLVALKYWGNNEIAASVAVVFLISMLAMAVSGFDTHREFYFSYFRKHSSEGIRNLYRVYCASTILQILVASPLIFGFVYFRFHDAILGILVTIFFASERIADESQRFLIFKESRQEWGARILCKALFQFFGILISVYFIKVFVLYFAVLMLLLGNLVAYGQKISIKYSLPSKLYMWKAIHKCLNQASFWALSMIATFVSYIDRVIVMIFQQSDMAIYTLLVSSMSVIQNAVDYFFVSIKRKEILQGRMLLRNIFLNKKFYGTVIFSSIAGCVIAWCMLYIYHEGRTEAVVLFPIVLISQITLSITMVIREIIYWNYSIRRLILLDSIFIVCVLISAACVKSAGLDYGVLLGIVSIILIFRLVVMAMNVGIKNNTIPLAE
jgi:hypothetical protein